MRIPIIHLYYYIYYVGTRLIYVCCTCSAGKVQATENDREADNRRRAGRRLSRCRRCVYIIFHMRMRRTVPRFGRRTWYNTNSAGRMWYFNILRLYFLRTCTPAVAAAARRLLFFMHGCNKKTTARTRATANGGGGASPRPRDVDGDRDDNAPKRYDDNNIVQLCARKVITIIIRDDLYSSAAE